MEPRETHTGFPDDAVFDLSIDGTLRTNASHRDEVGYGYCSETTATECGTNDGCPIVETCDTSDDTSNIDPVAITTRGNGAIITCMFVSKFTPTIELTKTGETLSKVRDSVDYTITLDNSSPEGPDIECTITDDKLGVNEFRTLAWDDPAYVIQKSHTVLPSDPVSLVNEVTATCTFIGEVDERASDSAERTTDPFQPAITREKTGDASSKIGGFDGLHDHAHQHEFGGDARPDLHDHRRGARRVRDRHAGGGCAGDGIDPFTLNAGATETYSVSLAGPFDGQATVNNTVTAKWALPGILLNEGSVSASDACRVATEARIIKPIQGLPDEAPNPTRPWTLTLQDCGTDGCVKDDPIIRQVTSPPSGVEFGVNLVPYEYDPARRTGCARR